MAQRSTIFTKLLNKLEDHKKIIKSAAELLEEHENKINTLIKLYEQHPESEKLQKYIETECINVYNCLNQFSGTISELLQTQKISISPFEPLHQKNHLINLVGYHLPYEWFRSEEELKIIGSERQVVNRPEEHIETDQENVPVPRITPAIKGMRNLETHPRGENNPNYMLEDFLIYNEPLEKTTTGTTPN